MPVNFHMFGSIMLNQIVCIINGHFVITIQSRRPNGANFSFVKIVMIVILNVWFVSYWNTLVLAIFLVYIVLPLLFILFIPIFGVPTQLLICMDIIIMLHLLIITFYMSLFAKEKNLKFLPLVRISYKWLKLNTILLFVNFALIMVVNMSLMNFDLN